MGFFAQNGMLEGFISLLTKLGATGVLAWLFYRIYTIELPGLHKKADKLQKETSKLRVLCALYEQELKDKGVDTDELKRSVQDGKDEVSQ